MMEMQAQQQSLQAQKDLLAYQSELRVQENLAISAGQELTKLKLGELDMEKWRIQNDVDKNNEADSLQVEQLKIQADKEKQDKEHEHEFKVIEAEKKADIEIEKSKPKQKSSK